MIQPTIYYVYDAYCGWCYGFSPVIKKLYENYKNHIAFDAISGGMILPPKPSHIRVMAKFIQQAYPQVEATTGIKFGSDFLWHINHPEESDWYPDSLKPAMALCIFKKLFPEKAVEFASDLSFALKHEGRDLCDNEAYRHLLEKYKMNEDDFYTQLKSDEIRAEAIQEFEWVKQLGISGFPCVLIQVSETKFYALSNGYVPYETLQANLEQVLKENS